MNCLQLTLFLTILTLMACCKKEEDEKYTPVPPLLDSLLKVMMDNGDTIYVHPGINNPPEKSPWTQTEYYSVEWGPPNENIAALKDINNIADAILDFNGEANTIKILAQLGTNGGILYAAKICADLDAYGFDDWYLPAAGELNQIYLHHWKELLNLYGWRWSSTEYHDSTPWTLEIGSGELVAPFPFGHSKTTNYVMCQCVRR